MGNFIYGKNTVTAYLRSNANAKVLYLFNKGSYNDLIGLAKKAKVKTEFVDKKKLDKLADGQHQGVVVLCDQLEDPHNLGAILRSCDACAVDGVIVGKHRSVGLTPTVAKVSTGAINAVKVAQETNMVEAIKTLKAAGYWVVAAENDVKAVNYDQFSVDMPIVLVVGSEGKGISRLVLKECDILTTIPMHGTVNSLNVSVATAILLFDIVRRRK